MITTIKRTVEDTIIKCDRCDHHRRVTATLREALDQLKEKKPWYLEELPDGNVRALCYACHQEIIAEWYNREKPFKLTDDAGKSDDDVCDGCAGHCVIGGIQYTACSMLSKGIRADGTIDEGMVYPDAMTNDEKDALNDSVYDADDIPF